MDTVYPPTASALARGRRLRRGPQRARTRTTPVTFAEIKEVDEENEELVCECGLRGARRGRRDELEPPPAPLSPPSPLEPEPAAAPAHAQLSESRRRRRNRRDVILEPADEPPPPPAPAPSRAASEPRAQPDTDT